MKIEFGWSLDGAGWADGGPRLGPRGLVRLLQGRLGLTRPDVEPAVRVAQYLRLLQDHLASHPDAWPARSAAADPWSTAAQLLRWRDAAIGTGWRPEPGPLSERLAILRDLEPADPGRLGPALGDDLREILELLEDGVDWPLGIDQILLAEAPERLPAPWPELLGRLPCRVVPVAAGDAPSVTIVEALDEWSAADAAARFLAADPQVTVLASGDTDVLDRALHRRGLPAIGRVESSRDRAHHQVLGLFLDVATAPVDVHQLAALLDLRVLEGDREPIGLVPARTRRKLLRALNAEPGVGGPAWRAAITDDEAAQVIDRLVTDPLPADDLRPGAIAARLDWLAHRLRAVGRGDGDLLASLTQVQVLQQVLGMLEADRPLSRRTLQQIIDSCGGAGRSPRAVPEVAPWHVTTSPAQVRPGTVLWWAPSTEDMASGPRWDAAERTALGAVPTSTELASLQVDAALAGLRRADEVVVVLPGRRLEKALPPNGLLAHLGAATTLRPEDLITEGRWELAGRSVAVATPAETPDPEPAPLVHHIAPAPHLLPTKLSYTQVAALIACPHHWALEWALGVRPAAVAALPTGSRMIGTLIHAVVETLVAEHGGVPSDAEILDVLDGLIPQLASELDLSGRAAEREEVRDRAVRSLRTLFTRLAEAGLRITGTETGFDVPLTLAGRTMPFRGSRDLDAIDAAGRRTVLDLKWSYSRTRYGDLFDTSEAIQLAGYAWALGQEHPEEAPADVGYFLLRSGEFVSADPVLDPHRRSPMDVDSAVARMVAAAGARLEEIAAGEVRCGCRTLQERDLPLDKARAADRAAGGLLVEEHCARGPHAQLCGTIGGLR